MVYIAERWSCYVRRITSCQRTSKDPDLAITNSVSYACDLYIPWLDLKVGQLLQYSIAMIQSFRRIRKTKRSKWDHPVPVVVRLDGVGTLEGGLPLQRRACSYSVCSKKKRSWDI
jgi:hypothetical protein